MAVYVTRNGTDWVEASEGLGAVGPVHGFDADSGRPVWRHPVSGHWVDGTGQVISPSGTGYGQFYSTTNSGLLDEF